MGHAPALPLSIWFGSLANLYITALHQCSGLIASYSAFVQVSAQEFASLVSMQGRNLILRSRYAREELDCIELLDSIWRSVCRYVGAFIVNQFASFFDESPPPQETGTGGQGPSPEDGPPSGTMPNLTYLTCAAELCKLESSFPCLYFAVRLQKSPNCGGFREHV
jgi:hypothetical protein